MISRRFKTAVIAGSVAGALAVAGFAPVVRHEAGQVAARYGGKVSIDRVFPAWRGAQLRGVDVTLEDIPSTTIHLDEVNVRFGAGGRTVELHGGVIAAVGSREVVLHEVEVWRARQKSAEPQGAAPSNGGGTKTSVTGLNLSWKNDRFAPTEAVSASGVSFSRDADHLSISASDASVTLGRAIIDAKHGRLALVRQAGSYRIGELAADSLEAQLVVPSGKAGSNLAPSESREPAGKSSIRAAIVSAARGMDVALDPSANVHLGGVRAHVTHGNNSVTLGPGQLKVARADGRMVIDLAPELASRPQGEREEALTFHLSVPLADPSAPAEIIADVRGGPIWLSTLGVKEGDFGLFDVARTSVVTRSHVVLSPDGETVRLDGEGKIHGLSLRSDALSDEPVAGLELAYRAKLEARLDGSRVHVDAGEVDLGAIRLLAEGDYERTKDTFRLRGTFEAPLTACQAMLDSVPKGLIPKLKGMRMAGSFGLKGKANFDTAHLDKNFVIRWDASNSCRVTEAPPEINVARFQHPFSRTAYDADGKPVTIEAGPGAPGWVSLPSITKFMEVAVLTTEDGGFRRHHGFDQEAIRNSIRENLRNRRFVRGASTISMQLAKNLYLDRGKTLSRKLQEAILTMYLEQELTKDQILELYLNVVEFGPMIYGIGPAARHYFNAAAGELALSQALYISSIMPNPKAAHFGAGGQVIPGYMNFLRRLMKIAHDRHNLSDEELDDGLRETVVRGSPLPQRDKEGPAKIGDAELPEPPEGTGDWLSP